MYVCVYIQSVYILAVYVYLYADTLYLVYCCMITVVMKETILLLFVDYVYLRYRVAARPQTIPLLHVCTYIHTEHMYVCMYVCKRICEIITQKCDNYRNWNGANQLAKCYRHNTQRLTIYVYNYILYLLYTRPA